MDVRRLRTDCGRTGLALATDNPARSRPSNATIRLFTFINTFVIFGFSNRL